MTTRASMEASSRVRRSPPTWIGRLAKGLALAAAATLVAATTAWGAAALQVAGPGPLAVRWVLSGVFAAIGLATLAATSMPRWRARMLWVFAASFGALLAWWATLTPSNDRDWQTNVAVLAYADVDGDRVTLHNIRNFEYRSESDFTPSYYDKTFDVRELESVDVVTSYWMGPHIAHVFLSFGFRGGDQLAVSIETRMEKGEAYSTLAGFFRQYELYYVVADERDVIRLRTNYRKEPPEDVYVFRIQGPIENGQRLFLEYVRQINALKQRAEFYNTATTNCTSTIRLNSRVNPGHLAWSWRMLLSGHVPAHLYALGKLDRGVPFAELQERAHVNARAQAADEAQDFSQRIRMPAAGQS
jgi:hypothetical protein